MGGKERGVGSKSLTKDHFNRNYWVIALSRAKNNISSMSAIRIRSAGPHGLGSLLTDPSTEGCSRWCHQQSWLPKSPDSAERKRLYPSGAGRQYEEEVGSNEEKQRKDTHWDISPYNRLTWPSLDYGDSLSPPTILKLTLKEIIYVEYLEQGLDHSKCY